MLDSIYVATSGLISFSNGLKNISNNVANINTPGFKATQLEFSDLLYQMRDSGGGNGGNTSLTMGEGTSTPLTTRSFAQGTVTSTGDDLDAAINGNGFFVLNADGKTFYTRSGAFQIDSNGNLVTQNGAMNVEGLTSGGTLQDISVGAFRTIPGKATTSVSFVNNLSSNATSPTFTVSGINVFDATGGSHALSVTFTNNTAATPGSWTFKVIDTATGTTVVSNGEVRFQGDGSPAAGFNTFSFGYTPPGAAPLTIKFNFGDPGSFSGATNFSGGSTSTLAAGTIDGFTFGSLTKTTFDSSGGLVFTYSNGQTANGPKVALATFDDLQALTPEGNAMFSNKTGQKPILGTAQSGAFGQIAGGSLEGANVDLAQEFSELIILQRGYQASSEAMTTANDLIQQLLDLQGKQ